MSDIFVRKDGEWVAASALTPPAPDFDPVTSIDWDAVYWADTLSMGDGEQVETWPDLSGNGHHLTQATGANRPVLDADGIGGRPSVNSDGVNDHLATTGWSASTEAVTFFAVATLPGATSTTLISGRLAATSRPNIGRTGSWVVGGGFGGRVLSSSASPTVVGAVFDTVSSRGFVGGDVRRIANPGSPAIDAFRMFSMNGTTGYSQARIAFAGVYPGDLVASPHWGSLLEWAHEHYGVTVTPLTVQQPHQIHRGAISGQNYEVLIPANYSGSAPLVLSVHGAGQTETAPRLFEIASTVVPALLDAGYIVASSAARGNAWGTAESVADYVALHDHVTSTYGISRTVILGQSMGGPASLDLLASGAVDALGGYLIYPVCNLDAIWAANYGAFRSQITAAYGITGTSPNTFDERTAGRNPTTDFTPSDFTGLRMRWSHGTTDVQVPKADHTDAMRTLIDAYTIENDVGVTGAWGHGSGSAFVASDVTSFFGRCTP